MLGLRFCARAFSSCGERGPLFVAVRGPLTVVASLVAEHRLQTRRLSSCGSRAQLLRGMWDLPRPGLEPVSPELAGRLSTTAPAGKPLSFSWASSFLSFFKSCWFVGDTRSFALSWIWLVTSLWWCFTQFLYPLYSHPSVSVGSVSTYSTNLGLKIFRKKNPESSRKQN